MKSRAIRHILGGQNNEHERRKPQDFKLEVDHSKRAANQRHEHEAGSYISGSLFRQNSCELGIVIFDYESRQIEPSFAGFVHCFDRSRCAIIAHAWASTHAR